MENNYVNHTLDGVVHPDTGEVPRIGESKGESK
jgi:hypothetical protein